jgi:uncharacterized membrane protein (DUF2068 family)
MSLVGVGFALPALFLGSDGAADAGDQPPFGILVLVFAVSLIGIVSSYGIWKVERWGVVLAIVVNAVSFLSGLPGVFVGPTAFLKVGSAVGCVANIVIVWLLLRRRPAVAATVFAEVSP